MKKSFYIALLLLFLLTNTNAQTSRQQELYFNRLSIENGLPQAQVFDFRQDKYGYMWIGTQSGLVRYDGYNCKTYSFGLKASWLTVKKIFEDKTGILWAGTKANGLYRYNRATDSFTQYSLTLNNNKDSFELQILNMQDDAFGDLWIKAESNFSNQQVICRFNIETGKCTYYGSNQKDNYKIDATEFNDLYASDNGKFFIASNNGIYEYDGKQEKLIPHFATADPAKQTGFKNLCADPVKRNVLWMSARNIKSYTAIGVYKFDEENNSFTVYRHDPRDTSTISDWVFAIKKDSKNQLWFATPVSLSVFNPGKNQFSNYFLAEAKKNKITTFIDQICEDKNGNFWCISGNDELVYFNTKTKTFTNCSIKHAGATSADNFYNLKNLNINKNGTLWTTNGDGLEWLNSNRSKFILYTELADRPHNFNGNKVWSFAAAQDGSLYLAGERGVYHWQPQTDSFGLVDFAKTKNYELGPCFITIDKKGCLWIGVQQTHQLKNGLYCYDPKTHKTQTYFYKENDSTSLSSDGVSCVFADRQDNIWVGTWGNGICKLNRQSNTFTRYGYSYAQNSNKKEAGNELDAAYIACIYQDKKGTIWAGCFDGGLNRYDSVTDTFAPFKIPGLRGVVHLSEDNEGNLWGGTYMDGAFKLNLNTNKLVQFSQEQGLLYNGVVSIMEDDHHEMWFITQRGISILNPYNNSFRSITKEYGLPENQNFSQFTSILKMPTGELVFGTNSGFIKLNPDDFSIDTATPEMHIETVSFTKNNSLQDSFIIIADKKDIHLLHNENRITFTYVGLEYQNTSLVQYVYKLDGYDNNWINAGTQRTVTYINLSPGTYTFHVKAANGDGVWNKQDESVNIVIAYPWWNTWWAYILYIAVLALIIWLFAAYRSKKLKQQNKLLEQKVEHRTEQLMQSLEELKSTQTQLIQSEKMASLGELTAGIAHEIQDPLNFVNNFSEVNKEMLDELQTELKEGNIDEAIAISNDIKDNEEKITHHGKRADAIVKGMLEHSRTSTGVKEPADINKIADEYLRLAYHGLRAKDKSFNSEMKTEFDNSIGKINIIQQDIGRVLLNLFNNAFYAVNEKNKNLSGLEDLTGLEQYQPTVSVQTKKLNEKIEITVTDNGNGIPQNIVDKIFQPFFTTKPTGQGTGLGLSLAYDIIKAHGGEIKVETKEGEGSEFVILLPA